MLLDEELTTKQIVICIAISVALVASIVWGMIVIDKKRDERMRLQAYFMVSCMENGEAAAECERQYYWQERLREESAGENATGKTN